MSDDIVITAWGFADARGFCGARGAGGAFGQDAAQWPEAFPEAFPRFGRLDPPCKLAMVAAELLGLKPPRDGVHADIGVSLGTRYGCLDADASFFATLWRPEGASPALFTYTLPSSVIAEVAMRYKLGGPNACFLAGEASGLTALWEGVRLVESGEARACVCLACDGVTPGTAAKMPGFDAPDAWEASAFLIERLEYARARDRAPLAAVSIHCASDTETTGGNALSVLRACVRGERDAAFASPAALRRDEALVVTAQR